jgi:hypothetical protein
MLGVYFLGKYNIGNKPMAGYDAKKAELYNRLRQQGLSEDAAAAQAGIGANDYNYEVNQVGTPATNPNYGKLQPISIRAKDPNAPPAPTADQLAEEAAANAELAEPPTKSSIKSQIYTTTSTETVSGGGSTTRIVNPSQPTPASQALQPALDAKQAELDQFNRDNPSNFARKRQGLPPLTPEENQERLAQQSKLVDEASQLRSQQKSLESGGGVTTVTVPNTTTTTTTVTTATSSVDTPVQSPGGEDTKVNQQTEVQLGTSAAATGGVTPAADPVPSTAEYSRATADAEVAAYGVEPAPLPPPTAEQIAAEDLAVYPNQAVSVEERERITQEEIAASDLEVYPRDVPATEDAGLYDQQQAILAAQAEQKQQDLYGSYGGASEAESNALTQARADQAAAQQTIAGQRKTQNNGDWRVRLRLAPRAEYLYLARPPGEILKPLADSDGVIFPYTPQISMGYRANYGQSDLTHSNYRGYFYQNSYVEAVNLKCTFTAQSTAEANYLLAVIHFFRSVTKMFYGQDPQRGAPPPLVYLSGLGQYQFNENPCVVSSFDYNLPSDVDYIRAGSSNMNQTNMQNLRPRQTGGNSSVGAFGALLGGALDRLAAVGVNKGAVNSTPPTPNFGLGTPTYVPTKLDINITLLPIQSRAQVSQQFSVRDFANGKLLKSGGFW